jgi:hypothetical protein
MPPSMAPPPTSCRVTQSDHVRIVLTNTAQYPHSLHLHGIHPANQDGAFQIVPAGGRDLRIHGRAVRGFPLPHATSIRSTSTWHVAPTGVMIVDPSSPRPRAPKWSCCSTATTSTSIATTSSTASTGCRGTTTTSDPAPGGPANCIYVVNITEFDALNSFHLHANAFAYYPAGTSLQPDLVTDVVHLSVANRGIIEFA